MTPSPSTESADRPGDHEQAVGTAAGFIYLLGCVLGAAGAASGNETIQLVTAIVIGIPLAVFTIWWLGLFLRRTARSYRAGRDG